MEHLICLENQLINEINKTNDIKSLEEIRIKSIGKQGVITLLIKKIRLLDNNEKKTHGKKLNEILIKISSIIKDKKKTIQESLINNCLKQEFLDISLPIYEKDIKGLIHPISQTIHEILQIFCSMGFSIIEGPEIEDDFHNFTALNFPTEHPAREESDTFYLEKKDTKEKNYLLRTHTSPVQIRTMKKYKAPIAIIAPGKVYRPDSDQTHSPIFHQIEGLVISEKIHMGHLKHLILNLCKNYFNIKDLNLQFRPAYFPFTEPSAEVDIGYKIKNKKIELGGNKSWLEVLGCGMIHKNVLINCNINPDKYQGFAFGIGVERFTMLKYGMPDLRAFYESDLRWIYNYGFDIVKSFSK